MILPTEAEFYSHLSADHAGPFFPGLSNIIYFYQKYFPPRLHVVLIPQWQPLQSRVLRTPLKHIPALLGCHHVLDKRSHCFPNREKRLRKKKELAGLRSCGLLCTFMEEQDLWSWGTSRYHGSDMQLTGDAALWFPGKPLCHHGSFRYRCTYSQQNVLLWSQEQSFPSFSAFSPRSAQSQDMSVGCGDSDTGSSCAIPYHHCSIADLHGSAWEAGFDA